MGVLDISVEDLPDSDAVSAGKYKLRIDEVVDQDDNGNSLVDRNGNKFLKIKFVITSGDFVNRVVRENYIPLEGRAVLKKILRAAGFKGSKLKNTDELVGLELEALVRVEKTEDFGDQNRVASYLGEEEPKAMKGVGKMRR